MRSYMKLLIALLLLGCFTTAHAGQRALFRERILDESGRQYTFSPGKLIGTGDGSAEASTGSLINGTHYVIFEQQFIPTQAYVYYKSAEGFTFGDIPNYHSLGNYDANTTTAYARRPCTYNLPEHDLSCTPDNIIIPREELVYAKKMGRTAAGVPLKYVYNYNASPSNPAWGTTGAITTDSTGHSGFRIPKRMKRAEYEGYYSYDDPIFGYLPQAEGTSTPTVVVCDITRPQRLTNAEWLDMTNLQFEWENTAAVVGVNHYAYWVEVYDNGSGSMLASGTISSNGAICEVPLTTNSISIYVYGFGEGSGSALYCFNGFELDFGSSKSTRNSKAMQPVVKAISEVKRAEVLKNSSKIKDMVKHSKPLPLTPDMQVQKIERVDCADCN